MMESMKMTRRIVHLGAVLLLVLGAQTACARTQQASSTEHTATQAPAASKLLPNGRTPLPDVLTGGQPSNAQLQRLADLGYKTVINLRTEGEPGTSEEPDTVKRLGMNYVSIPVAGTNGLTRENAERLEDALNSAQGETAIHCGSGNRVGALLALKAYWLDGKSAEDALKLGLDAGLTHLEPAVRQHLGLSAN